MQKYDLLIRCAELIKPKVAVEIGCQPFPLTDELAPGYGLSTWKLGEYLNSIFCIFHSVDIDEAHLKNAENIAKEKGVQAIFHLNDGATFLNEWPNTPIDMLYLDNASKPEITLEQFITAIPKMSENSLIVCDDAHSDQFGMYSKATLVIPYAMGLGYKVSLYPCQNSIMAVIHKEISYVY